MKALIEVFCELEENNNSLVYNQKKEFQSEQELNEIIERIMDSFDKIYEDKFKMMASIKIDSIRICRDKTN